MKWACAAAAFALTCAPAAGAELRAELAKLRTMDQRLADVAYRLTTANAALCRDLAPGTGMTIGALDQYAPALRNDARAVLGFETPVGVAAVARDSPAARAGVRPGDSLVAIEGRSVEGGRSPRAASATRDAVLALLASSGGPALHLTLQRDGRRRDIVLPATLACRAIFEVVIRDKLFAQADTATVQLSTAHFERFDDAGIAVTAAHELAHVVLRHRARLSAAGVARGLAAKFGRNRRLTRQAEDEADRLSVHLLRNAGYDPAIALAFWSSRMGDKGPGVLGHRTHAAPDERAAIIAAEIARIPAGAAIPYVPVLLGARDATMQ